MAGKCINEYTTYTGSSDDVNILVQQTSQTEASSYEHKKMNLGDVIDEKTDALLVQSVTDGDTTHAPSGDAVYDKFSTIESSISQYGLSVDSEGYIIQTI